jgi:glutamate-ammonia-ligase adenylyltransferase
MLEKILNDAAAATPDPERAFNNLYNFCHENPECREQLNACIKPVSLLFSHSQFLANFAISNPELLFESLNKLNHPVRKESLASSLLEEIGGPSQQSREKCLSVVRNFKKKTLLLITMRDILNIADISESMNELSMLADVIVEASLGIAQAQMRNTYGEPVDDAFSVIAVGKLGGNELNFSSDIDLIYVYKTEDGETRGVAKPGGVTTNRISNHEYYCKLGENLNRFLTMSTGDGFAYRVDLRLRPEGQRGSLAMSLPAYEIYYESWGRAWERAVFLRARPIAGDVGLGRSFMEMIRPFVYRKYLDFSAIDEIRRMKTRIDEKFKKDDIKRGYGGIREIEFFVQAIQLIYGGREPLLRERSILKALHRLLQKNLVGHEDFSMLSGNYVFLRKLEHRLQQLNDLQTHSIPTDEKEIRSLGRKMGFPSRQSFISELERRRRMVRRIYDSLFIVKEAGHPKGAEDFGTETPEAPSDAEIFFSEEITDSEMLEILSGYSVRDRERAVRNIRHIKDNTLSFQTLRGRRLLSMILPQFLHEALKTGNPDKAINNLQSFALLLASEGSYLEMFAGNARIIPALANIFSRSEYLSKNIIKRQAYLELLGHELFAKKTLRSLKKELSENILQGKSIADSIRMLRQMEEIRLGVLFLERKIDTIRLVKSITKAAEAVLSVCTGELSKDGLAVIGMGKAGGRELTFSSDLDLIFACGKEITETDIKAAERLIRLLTSHTKDGIAYNVDARLRPDGTKGPLVSTLDAFRDYYSKAAHFWEFQALLKARPVAGNRTAGCSFMEMRRDVLLGKGGGVSASDIRSMRERILKELSKETEGYDVKLGTGGIEELEFTVQYLQLKNALKRKDILVQGTVDAIRRLETAGIIDGIASDIMEETYIFYRTIESLLRLKGEPVLKKDTIAASDIAEFMGFKDSGEFFGHMDGKMGRINALFERFLC